MSASSKHHKSDAEGRFTSSLALPSEADGYSTSVWLQQDDVRQAQCTEQESSCLFSRIQGYFAALETWLTKHCPCCPHCLPVLTHIQGSCLAQLGE